MASLKDTVVQGSLRATDTLFSTIAQFQILHAPTTNGGSTYGIGSNGQIIKSNGTNIYWGTDEDTKVTQIPTTTNATYELLFSYTSNNNELTENARKTNTLTYNPSTKALLIGSNYDGTINGLTLIPSATSGFSISGGTSSKTLTVNNNYTLNNACEKDYTDNSSATNVTYDDEKLITARTLYYQLDNFGIYSQNANLVFAGPTSGGVAAAPSFRSLVAADIPTISILNQTSGTLSIERGGTGVTTIADIQAGKDGDGNTISSTYLKLNGGTMTGKITFNNVTNAIAYTGTNATYDMISFIDNTDDEYGNGIYIGGGGATIIGGGESAATAAAQVTGGSEILYLCNDGDVNVFSNLQSGWNDRKTFTFGANGTLTAPAFSGPLTGNVTGNCSGSAGSVAWENVTGKPSTYSPSAHTHYELATIGDNRDNNTTPNTYSNRLIFQGLKKNSAIGSPYTDTYSYLVGLRGWSDSSGGDAHEFAFNDNGIYRRQGGTTSWDNWKQILDSGNYTSYCPTKTGSGASGTWGISITGNAATATKATQDGSGNTITSTYLKLSGGTLTGNIYVEAAGERAIAAQNSTVGTRVYLLSSNPSHGLYSNGYYNGSSFVSSNKWMVYRYTDGNVYLNGHARDDLALSGGTMTGVLINGSGIFMGSSSGVYYASGAPMFYFFRGNSNTLANRLSCIFMNTSTTNSITRPDRMYFRQYSYNSSTGAIVDYVEQYRLPAVTSNRTSSSTYDILTDKNAVTVAQGGTGATSAASARTNLGIHSGVVTITSNSSGDATITSSTISINFKPSVFVATPCTSASTGYYISYNKDSSTTSTIYLKVYSGTTKVAVSSLRINYIAIN